MQKRAFQQVDVFSATPYFGNALAVVMDGTGLTDAQMQRFARWTNLSETTFLLPPTPAGAAAGAHYRVRIFTSAYEMPFAGHPTLGSCHAWLRGNGAAGDALDVIIQECQVGLVQIRRSRSAQGDRLAFAAPPLKHRTPSDHKGSMVNTSEAALVSALTEALGLQSHQVLAAQFLDNGPRHFGFLVDHRSTVLQLKPDLARLAAALRPLGVTGVGLAAIEPFEPDAQPEDSHASPLILRSNREARAFAGNAPTAPTPNAEIRFFFHADARGVGEDCVTGSFNASMAQWLITTGRAPRQYLAAQGTVMGCEGRIHISQDPSGQVWVGGDSVTCIDGHVTI
jgi:PhzF family phenazine biosynthesis protein